MYHNHYISVIIPVLNEEQSIGKVIAEIPGYVDQLIVADNGSTDNTAAAARDAGAVVVFESNRGYGSACLRGMRELNSQSDIVVFLDGDYSDYPEEMSLLLDQIVYKDYSMVIGSRMLYERSKKFLTPVARFGNWLATRLIKLIWSYSFSDLGPFRAVTSQALQKMHMEDKNFGWTVEMQIKAAKLKIPSTEIPVSYRQRIGYSKISGTITGSVKAGSKILYLIVREMFR